MRMGSARPVTSAAPIAPFPPPLAPAAPWQHRALAHASPTSSAPWRPRSAGVHRASSAPTACRPAPCVPSTNNATRTTMAPVHASALLGSRATGRACVGAPTPWPMGPLAPVFARACSPPTPCARRVWRVRGWSARVPNMNSKETAPATVPRVPLGKRACRRAPPSTIDRCAWGA